MGMGEEVHSVADDHARHDGDRAVADDGGHGAFQELGQEQQAYDFSAVAEGEMEQEQVGAFAVAADDKRALPVFPDDAKNDREVPQPIQIEEKDGAALVAGVHPAPHDVAHAGEDAPDADWVNKSLQEDWRADNLEDFEEDLEEELDAATDSDDDDDEDDVETPPQQQQHDPLLDFFVECDEANKGEKPCTSCFCDGKDPVRRSFSSKSMKPHYSSCHRPSMRSVNLVECTFCKNFFKNLADYYRHRKNIHGW